MNAWSVWDDRNALFFSVGFEIRALVRWGFWTFDPEFLGSEQDHSVVPRFIQLVEDDFNLVTENFRMLLCLEEENLDSSIKSRYESIKSEMSHVMSRMSNAYPGCFDKRSCKDSPSSVAQGGSYIDDTLL